MNTIHSLTASLSKLNITESGPNLSECAAFAVLDSHTLAVVPFADRNAQQIYDAITGGGLHFDDVTIIRNAITVTI